MHFQIRGNEDIETSVNDEEISYLTRGCNFVKEHLSQIFTDVLLSKSGDTLEDVLCYDVTKACDGDGPTEEVRARRELKKKLNEEANKRILRTGNARAPGTSAG